MKISNLTKRFGEKVVFDNLSLEIKENQVTYIMGESGCGNTTLLRILSGLDKDYTGEIPVLDSVSYVFQEPRLFPTLTVQKNVEIVGDLTEFTSEYALKLVELQDEKLSFPNTLSGGMKMRVALARAIYHNKSVYLMDEPFSALDEEMKSRILPQIFTFFAIKNKTVIIISHDKSEAEKYGDNIIILKNLKV